VGKQTVKLPLQEGCTMISSTHTHTVWTS